VEIAALAVLTYAYTYERSQTDDGPKAYGVDKMDPGGGGTFYIPNINQHYRSPSFGSSQPRSGTIAVEVVRQEADGGLVLRISEPAPISSDAQTCVVFGDTTVVCDASHPVSPEAQTLLQFMGSNFIDAARLDARRHWRLDPAGSNGTVADYTIARTAGNEVDVAETGVLAPAGSPKTEIAASIAYDTARSLPLSVDESTLEREQRGVILETVTTHVVLSLKP
jgi:hypothetical protein